MSKNKSYVIVTTNFDWDWLNKRKKGTLFFLAVITMVSSILAVYYYTGQTPFSTYRSLSNNISVYYQYQQHFKIMERNIFSFTKIPFILMLFHVKIITFYSYVSFIMSKRKLQLFQKTYLVFITISYIYIGVARGTNFEFFEIIMLIIFILLCKQKISKTKIPIKAFMKIALLISMMILIFYTAVTARGFHFNTNISQDVFFDPEGIIPNISTFLSFITLILYGYFGFGFFYTSMYVSSVWFSSMKNFIIGFIPFGYKLFSEASLTNTMRDVVDIGVKWQPDNSMFIENYGYIGLLIICFLLGVFARYLQRHKDSSPIVLLTSFMILLQMVSLPIGNFISASSASKLIVLFLVLYWLKKCFLRSNAKTI